MGGGYGSVYDHLGGELPEDAARIPYGSEAPYCRIRSVEWLGEETLSLRFKVTHPWIQVGRMRPYIVLRRRLGNKYANKWAEFRGKQDELVLAPEILSFKSNGESHFVVQLSFPQINDLIKLEHGDSLNLYIRYVCDDASRTSEERFGNERPKGTFAIYKSKAPVTGDTGFYPYETGKKYLGFRIMSPKAAELRELARRLNHH